MPRRSRSQCSPKPYLPRRVLHQVIKAWSDPEPLPSAGVSFCLELASRVGAAGGSSRCSNSSSCCVWRGGVSCPPPRHRSPKSWAVPEKVLCQLLAHKPEFFCAIHLKRLVANFAESTGMTWVQRKSPRGDAKTPQDADPCLTVLGPSAQRASGNKKRGRPLSHPPSKKCSTH